MDIVEMYQSGMSAREIATVVGKSHTKVLSVLKNAGVIRRTKREALARHVRFNVCVICGKRFRARMDWKAHTRLDRKTCSSKCLSELMRSIQRGGSNSNWTGGASQAHYQRIRETYKLQICEICGTTEGRLDTHHKDHNKSNNDLNNLMVLCAACHTRLHQEERSQGGMVANSKN